MFTTAQIFPFALPPGHRTRGADRISPMIKGSKTMRLATWNVALPVAVQRREAVRAHIDRQLADVWVLTEAHDGLTLGHSFVHSSRAGRDGRHGKEHHWVTIWSNAPLEPLETSDSERSAA